MAGPVGVGENPTVSMDGLVAEPFSNKHWVIHLYQSYEVLDRMCIMPEQQANMGRPGVGASGRQGFWKRTVGTVWSSVCD